MPTLPPSHPAPVRHLGTQNPKPLRSPAVLGLLSVLVLIALPVYVLRRPRPIKPAAMEMLTRPEPVDAGPGPDAVLVQAAEVVPSKRVTLSDPKTARCFTKGGGRATTERCDRIPTFEDALARSIRENVACAPPSNGPYTVSFVLTLDFGRKSMHLWSGASGTLRKRLSTDLVHCVEHAIVPPEWEAVPHQFQKYDVNLIASYPGGGMPTAQPLGGP